MYMLRISTNDRLHTSFCFCSIILNPHKAPRFANGYCSRVGGGGG